MARWAITERPRIGRADESTRGRGRRARERARVSGGEARARAMGTAERERARGASVKCADERTRRGGGAGGDTPAARMASRRRARSTRAIVGTSLPTIRDPGAAGSFAPWLCLSIRVARAHTSSRHREVPRGAPAVPGPRRDVRGAFSRRRVPARRRVRGRDDRHRALPRDVPTHPPRVRPPRRRVSRPRDPDVSGNIERLAKRAGDHPALFDIAREMAAGTHESSSGCCKSLLWLKRFLVRGKISSSARNLLRSRA